MPSKLIIILSIALALSFYACSNKSANSGKTMNESFVLQKEHIVDPALSFEEYQPIFEEILDSLLEVVLNLNNRQLFTCECTGV